MSIGEIEGKKLTEADGVDSGQREGMETEDVDSWKRELNSQRYVFSSQGEGNGGRGGVDTWQRK